MLLTECADRQVVDERAAGREGALEAEICHGIDRIAADDWDSCAGDASFGRRPTDPFTTHRFLLALEQSGSVGEKTSWQPVHVKVSQGGTVIAVMPLYVKYDSNGEFVFDHGWAHAFEQAGGRYYPKLQSAVPFTPATGRRFLTRDGYQETGRAALSRAALQLALNNQISSLHITFCTESEAKSASSYGFMRRSGEQFHWHNDAYGSFAEFLARLSARKRKNIRRERSIAAQCGGVMLQLTGDDILPEHWDAFWRFYQDTGARKWGMPYLTRAFFDAIHASMRDDILLVMCRRDGRYIAGALNFVGRETLYGRYWGCIEDHPCLHFETCYYQAIDFAIAHGLSGIEAGAQGQHKLARGYMPVETRSLHWIVDVHLRKAVAEYLKLEHKQVERDISWLSAAGPFKKKQGDER